MRLLFSPKYRSSTFARLGFQVIPKFSQDEPVYWIHSVSVGETQVARTLTAELLAREPQARVVVSTITETGQAVARKIPGVAATLYYPLDFSFLAARMLRRVQPRAIFIVETDLWFNFLDQARIRDIPLFLVNGKISATTLKRYKQFPRLCRRLLAPFHHFFTQSETYLNRFAEAGIPQDKLVVAGNVKLDGEVPRLEDSEKLQLAENYGLRLDNPLLVFGSTHAGEEELAVETFMELKKEFANLQCALVPRHPERFNSVAEMLAKRGLDFNRASQMSGDERAFVLIDEMGALMKLYSICTVGIVAGTFTPDIGGHNILEPSFYGKPFVYGPWIYKQPGFHQMNLDYKAGVQCKPEGLSAELHALLSSPKLCADYGQRGLGALELSRGATKHIIDDVMNDLISR
ncbi:MAG: hypothetical protein HRT88_15540 [Lentisphaeraceae bacterium]|nr:hypothetical protein [Lentisphaeraceae bacterium]